MECEIEEELWKPEVEGKGKEMRPIGNRLNLKKEALTIF